jgi:hypothetical protein
VFLGQVGGDDAGVFVCERDSGRAADAVTGAGDEDDLPAKRPLPLVLMVCSLSGVGWLSLKR